MSVGSRDPRPCPCRPSLHALQPPRHPRRLSSRAATYRVACDRASRWARKCSDVSRLVSRQSCTRSQTDHKLTKTRKLSICSYFLCARVDSNHHPVYTGQGPQPRTPAPYASARVQIVRSVRICGHIGRIGRNDLCQRCVTRRGGRAWTANRRANLRSAGCARWRQLTT